MHDSSKKKSLFAVLALIGACAACCALPFIGVLSGAAAVAGAGAWLTGRGEVVVFAMLAITVLLALVIRAYWRRRRASRAI